MNRNLNKEIKSGIILILMIFLGILGTFVSLFALPKMWVWLLLFFWPIVSSVYSILLITFIIFAWYAYILIRR